MAVELKFETQRGFEIRWEKRKKILSSNLDMHANAVKIFCRKKTVQRRHENVVKDMYILLPW